MQELVFNHDGSILASGHADNTIRLWNVADNTEIAALSGQALTLAFSPDHSKILASGGHSSIIALWNFDLEELLRLGCQELLKYADNYPGFSEEDRQLCETIISRYAKNES